jgi:preprotein translocase SecE subunit
MLLWGCFFKPIITTLALRRKWQYSTPMKYLNEVMFEMKHVVWPTQKEVTAYTVVTIVATFVVAYYLGLFDWIFSELLESALTR